MAYLEEHWPHYFAAWNAACFTFLHLVPDPIFNGVMVFLITNGIRIVAKHLLRKRS